MADRNRIEEALAFSHDWVQSESAGEDPGWTPEFVMNQLHEFCDEIRAVQTIIDNALVAGDIQMISRAAAQLQHIGVTQFNCLSSTITFVAGKVFLEQDDDDKTKGKYEHLFEALHQLHLIDEADIEAGRNGAQITDMMQSWVSDQNDAFMYLMSASLRDAGWSDEALTRYNNTEVPELVFGPMEDFEQEIQSLFQDDEDDD